MNAPFQLTMSKPEFLRWIERQERKHEWKEGHVVQMTNVTKAHARIVSNIMFALRSRLTGDTWSVTASDLGVEDEDFIRYPDVIVEPMDDDDKGRRSRTPVLIVEVLSPSSVGTDFTQKREEYTRLASLAAYLIVSQDEAIAWLWRRGAEGSFPGHPEEIRGRDTTLDLPRLAITLPLSEIYRGIAISS